MTKTCTRCGVEKPEEEFSFKYKKSGNRRAICRLCQKTEHLLHRDEINAVRRERLRLARQDPVFVAKEKEAKRASYQRRKHVQVAWRKKNRAKVNEGKLRGYYRNKEAILIRQKAKRDADIEAFREKRKQNRIARREEIRKYDREYGKTRRQDDVNFRILGNLRNRIRLAIRNKSESTKDLLGCSLDEFKAHLQAQFTPEMNWENYGSYWSIDHIIPCAAFDLTDPEQQKKCFHWTNCQPLTKSQNSIKSGKTLPGSRVFPHDS